MVPSRIRPCDPVVFVPILKIQTTIFVMAQKITLEASLSLAAIFKDACPHITIEFTKRHNILFNYGEVKNMTTILVKKLTSMKV